MKASERGSTLEAPHERVSGCACTARRAAVRACCSLVRPGFTSARALVCVGTRTAARAAGGGAQLGGWSARARSIIRSNAYRRSVLSLSTLITLSLSRLRVSFFDFLSPLDEPGVRHIPRDAAGRPYTLWASRRALPYIHDYHSCADALS